MPRRFLVLLLPLLLLCGDLPAASARPLRLVMTHPIARYLQAVLDLARGGRLGRGELEIVGVFHEDEAGDYAAARTLVKGHPAGALCRLETLRGALRPDEIWKRNRLSGAFRRLFLQADGILFMGGPDLPPWLYGEKALLTTVVTDTKRHLWELSFLAHLVGGTRSPGLRPFLAERPGLPLLCICLGMQSLNVAAGGTLVQDVPSELYGCATVEEVLALGDDERHRNYSRALDADPRQDSASVHAIRASAPWPFPLDLPQDFFPLVCSVHHQAVETLGAGLAVVARSMDGRVVEALRHERFPAVLAVQFHPERPQVFDAGLPGLLDAQGPSVASRFAGSPLSRRFHDALWRWFTEAMEKSRTGPASKQPSENRS